MKTILQTEKSECGLACLAMIASHFGLETDLYSIRQKFSVSLKGLTLEHLTQFAGQLNLSSRAVRIEMEDLQRLTLPCILHWDHSHFVVLKKITRSLTGKTRLHIVDPATGAIAISLTKASRRFTGVALELLPTPEFVPEDIKRRVHLKDLTGKVIGLRRTVVKATALAAALEIFALAAPFFNQLIIDEVLVTGDHELLIVLAVGFFLIIVTQQAIGLARSWFLVRWSMELNLQWTARVLAHLLKLPASFFEKRHMGDIVSRIGSVGAIQQALSSLFLETALDGVMASFVLILMFAYSPLITGIVLSSLALYVAVRWIAYGPLREATHERMIVSGKESSYFLETIRASIVIKLFNRENERLSVWQDLRIAVQNLDLETQKISIATKSVTALIFGVSGIVVLYVGAQEVLAKQLSLGMLMAFSTYASTFSSRVSKLVDVFVTMRMLSIHTERLADIVYEPKDDVNAKPYVSTFMNKDLEFRDVSFRYGDNEPWILRNVNLKFSEGDCVAITGPSGGGKSTICKLILGLVKPTSGEILYGGTPLQIMGYSNYRDRIGCVMQEDTLLAGSILENITFFSSAPDVQLAEKCAKLASVHDEISVMPMSYQTLVGDMGSSLSGGQKQRVLLARALYREPSILVLDEATSHLDLVNERKVSSALMNVVATRIFVAHRPETIRFAKQVYDVGTTGVFQREQALDVVAP